MHPPIDAIDALGTWAQPGPVSDNASRPLRVTFRTAKEFAREYDENLVNMGLFVPTEEVRAVREIVDFLVIVPFRQEPIRGRGEVIYTLDAEQAEARGVQQGLGLQVLEFDMKAAAEGRRVVRERLASEALQAPEPRRAVRIPAKMRVRYRTRQEFEEGVARDISMGGIFLRTEEPFPIGTAVQIVLVRPLDGKEMTLDGLVARTPLVTTEDGPKIGMGIKFKPLDAAQLQELERFVRYHGLSHRARSAQEIRGRVRDTGVEGVIHLFCHCRRDGELILRDGEQAGRIVFKDAHVVRAELPGTGICGERAFYRMMTWVDSDFEYRHRPVQGTGSMNHPGDRLVREGMRMRDEVAEWSRRIPSDRQVTAGPKLNNRAIPEEAHALIELLPGRPRVGTVLDRIGGSDVEAYRILAKLHQAGVVQFQ